MMRIVFRYDDFSAGEEQSHETDAAVFELFMSLGVPLVVGVTPCMSKNMRDAKNEVFYPIEEDLQRIELLRQGLDKGWQLALHGYTHQQSAAVAGTEFAQEPREVQHAKIERGLTILRRCFPETALDVLIPPWNSFDQTTLDCAARAGFSVLCGGDTWQGQCPKDIVVVPSLMSGRRLVDYVRCYSLKDLARMIGDAWLIVTLHGHEFRLLDHVEALTLDMLREILQQIRSEKIAVDVLPLDKNASYAPRHGTLLRAKVHWLEQMGHGPGHGWLRCAQFLDQRLWGQGGSLLTNLAVGAPWGFAVLCARAKAYLRHLRKLYRKGSASTDLRRAQPG